MSLFSLFIQINLVVSVSAAIAFCFTRCNKNGFAQRITELKLNYFLLALCLAIPILSIFGPQLRLINPPIEVWSRPSMHFDSRATAQSNEPSISISIFERSKEFSERNTAPIFIYFLLFTLAVLFTVFGRDNLHLLRIVRSSFLIRRIGSVSIYFSDSHSVPFSFWFPGNYVVVIPSNLLRDKSMCAIAIRHELQHHRQGDTRWASFIYFMNFFCWFNPLYRLFRSHMSELQEFACDEVLIGHKEISPHAYGSCLLAVAETVLRPQRLPFGATGMAGGSRRSTINRRITYMFKINQAPRRGFAWIIGAVSLGVITTVVFASSGTIQDRRITMSEAQKLAAKAAEQTEFPVEVNEQVLLELNRFAGTPDGREWVKKSLERMKAFDAMIEQKLAEHRLPAELKAVPLVESGFQNLPQEKNPTQHGAGLWQFIPGSARAYDLVVNDERDDRLDPAKETDAALRYLGAMYLRFGKDWRLALMAYNMGERHVQKARDLTKSSDAWKLTKAGYQNDKGYLARVIAVTILMKNPEVLN